MAVSFDVLQRLCAIRGKLRISGKALLSEYGVLSLSFLFPLLPGMWVSSLELQELCCNEEVEATCSRWQGRRIKG